MNTLQRFVLVVSFTGCWTGVINAPCAWADRPKLHALLVFDTDARRIGPSVEIDLKNWKTLLDDAFGGKVDADLNLRILEGAEVTWEKIRDYYEKELDGKVASSDTLLFYYTGHGGLSKQGNQRFYLQHDPDSLYRFHIEGFMSMFRARCNIILYDCCSNAVQSRSEISDDEARELREKASPIASDPDLFTQLFFRAENWVIISSTQEGRPSYCDNRTLGGMFTSALLDQLGSPVKELDLNKDGVVNWTEFYSWIREGTNMRHWGQSPQHFYLEDYRESEYILAVKNATDEPLQIRVRYSLPGGELSKWLQYNFEPGEEADLAQAGNVLKLYDYQIDARGKRTGSRWCISTNAKLRDQLDARPIIASGGISYNSGKDGTAIRRKLITLND